MPSSEERLRVSLTLPRIYRTLLLGNSLHSHDAYELIYVSVGEMSVTVDGTEVCLCPGDYAVLDRNVLHSIRPGPAQPPEGYLLLAGRNELPSLFETLDSCRLRVFSYHDDGDVGARLEELYRTAHTLRLCRDTSKLPLYAAAVACQASAVFLSLFCRDGAVETVQRKESIITPMVIEYLDEHYTQNLTIADIAAHFGYTPEALSRYFERSTKKSLKVYMEELRVVHASKLLDVPSPSGMLEIADQSGFGSVRTFYRVFHRHTGMTPTEWRKSVREAASPKDGRSGS